MEPFHIVPIQLKNFTPVGTAMRNDIAEKKRLVTAPVVNMWWAQTPIERPAIANAESTNSTYPKTGLRENVAMISVMTPKYGKNHHVDFGMPEEPKQVLVEDRVSAVRRVEEMAAEMPVDQEHREDGRERRKRH